MLDRRAVFAIVFLFTLLSTVIVAAACLYFGQTATMTVVYSLATMWLVGVFSQILLHNLYQAVVKPLEEELIERRRANARSELNLEGVEAIDEANERIENAQKKVRKAEEAAEALLNTE